MSLSKREKIEQYRGWVDLVKQQTGKSLLTQLKEIRALRKHGGECGISDYYNYKLYDESFQCGRGAADFVGWKLQPVFSQALNPRNAVLPAWDKGAFMVIAHAAGLPVAPVQATYHRADKISEALGRHLRTHAEVLAFLRDPANYPVFAKAAYSQQGYGSEFLNTYDAATDSAVMLNGERMKLETFIQRLDTAYDRRYHVPECGFLFQRAFKLAPEIFALTQWSALCTARVICLNDGGRVKPVRAIWKIAVPPNHVDNFSLGKNGNYLGNIDLATGKVERVVNGFWPEAQVCATHPSSGQAFEGFQLPGWDKVLDACQRAGYVFPRMRIHHWDFAFTEQGPMILELNDMGGTEIAQVHGHGLLTEEIREFLKRHGSTVAHPWIKKL